MLDAIAVTLYIGIFYILTLPLGYLLLHLKEVKAFSELPFFVRLPVYISIGLCSSTIIYFLWSLIDLWVYLPIFLFISTLLVILIWKTRKGSSIEQLKIRLTFDKVIPLFLLLISLIHFCSVTGYLRWPPVGDITIGHGVTVSLFLQNNGFPLTYEPISIVPVRYPLGFHATAANWAILTGRYPGEAVFLLGAAIIALIPSILYSLTYIKTRSKLFSFLVYLSPFLIHPSLNLERWITGYFYNGPYPNMYGLLSIFTFCVLISLRHAEPKTGVIHENDHLLVQLLIGIELFLVYPIFSFFVIFYLLLVNARTISLEKINHVITHVKSLTRKRVIIIFLICIASLSVIYASQTTISLIYNFLMGLIRSYVSMVFGKEFSQIPSTFLFDSIPGLIVLVAFFTAIYFIVKRVHVKISLFYLIVFIPLAISLVEPLYPYMSLLIPDRSMIINTGLSWILVLSFIHYFIQSKVDSKGEARLRFNLGNARAKGVNLKVFTKSVVFIIIISLFLPSTYLNFSMAEAQKWGFYSTGEKEMETFEADFEGLVWIDREVPPEDLILNDLSWSSFSLMSFSVKNLTFFFIKNRPLDEYLEIKQIWNNPYDGAYLRRLIQNYDIKYVFISSEWGYYDWVVFGGDSLYKGKPLPTQYYVEALDRYPFLVPRFRKGNTVVYEVV